MARAPSEKPGTSREHWDARVAALTSGNADIRRAPLSVPRVIDAALAVVSAEGYEALSMRRVATVLRVTPGALYVHVRDKAELDDLMIGRLSSQVRPPNPDPSRWKEQFLGACQELRAQYDRYPGIALAVFATAPDNLDSLRVTEGLLSILLAGGVRPHAAAWAVDAALLQVAAHSVVALRRYPQRRTSGPKPDPTVTRAELLGRVRSLPRDLFPSVVDHAGDLLAGDGHDRLDFTLHLLLDGLVEPASSSKEHREH